MSRVNTKFDIRELVLENTSLVRGTCSLSYKKDQEQRGMIRGEKAKTTVEERL